MGSVNANRWAVGAFIAATLGALVGAFAPTYSWCATTPSGGEVCGHATSFAVNGSWVLVVVAVPVLVALIPTLMRRRTARVVSAVLLWIGCVVGMWSVGMFFVPAAILMTVAATRRWSPMASPMPPVPIG
jgi:hypothetical protein